MGDITDLDLTGLIKDKSGNPLGDAHELLVRSILMRLGFEVGKIDLSSSPYDLVIFAFVKPGGRKTFLRAQIKTISGTSLSLTGGSRAGVDRDYKSSEKIYKYSKKDADIILGVDKKTFDVYVLPILCAKKYRTSVSKSKLQLCKNNWDILQNWNAGYLKKIEKQLPA